MNPALALTLVDFQLDAQNSYLFIYNTFIKILYMFRALPCSSSGGLRRNCIYAASGIVTVCRWLSCAPAKKELVEDDYIYIYIYFFLCIKLEINKGYTTMHGQPFIKTCTCRLSAHDNAIFLVQLPT